MHSHRQMVGFSPLVPIHRMHQTIGYLLSLLSSTMFLLWSFRLETFFCREIIGQIGYLAGHCVECLFSIWPMILFSNQIHSAILSHITSTILFSRFTEQFFGGFSRKISNPGHYNELHTQSKCFQRERNCPLCKASQFLGKFQYENYEPFIIAAEYLFVLVVFVEVCVEYLLYSTLHEWFG